MLRAFGDKAHSIARPMRQSLSYDRANWVKVYLCGQNDSWQRRSNENPNGLKSIYLSKGIDLPVYGEGQLDAITDEKSTAALVWA